VIREAFVQALRLLRAHKARSLLTLFGLAWGAASVIFLSGWGAGVITMLERGFFKTGKNMGEVWAGKVGEDFTPAADRRWLWFTYDDALALRRRSRLAEVVGAEAWEMLPVAYHQRIVNVDLRGIDPEVMEVRGVPLAAGRGITRADVDHRRRVALVGFRARRRLLGVEGGLDSWVRIGGTPFRVVGLIEELGTQLSRDRMEIDDQVWIPIATLQALWPRPWTDDFVVTKLVYRIRDRQLLADSKREVRAILADRIGVSPQDEEAVPIWSSIDFLNTLPLEQTRSMLAVLAAATLLIGGIGVLNMMLDSVYERRQEIGVRLAIGARRRDVVAQFFLETLTLCALGGGVGVALGVGGCALLESLPLPEIVPVPELGAGSVLLALGVLSSVGVAAGVIPAWRAARVDPASILRME
jgi:putative ABC transport system permease protein